jgi:hypothetical protein
MIYALLILPHLCALGGLFMFAYRAESGQRQGFGDGPGGEPDHRPPEPPAPAPAGDPLPLPLSGPPRRRLQDGERLADLHPHPRRREYEPASPGRAPTPR